MAFDSIKIKNSPLKKNQRVTMGDFIFTVPNNLDKDFCHHCIEKFDKDPNVAPGMVGAIRRIDRETKTSDDVFVALKVSVQFIILKEKVFDAYYRLENPREQINAYVFDVVRAEVPKMKLDDVFIKKDDIAIAIKSEIEEAMSSYGYGIIKALVTDIDPDAEVKRSMNHINAAERQKLATEYEAEAERIRIVARAKAEAESKRLQGQGIADQRREIARGLEESVEVLNKVGINSQEASALIVVTQHYDTLQSMGENSNSNLVLLPNSPAAGSNMLSEMVTSFTASQMLGEKMKEENKVKK